MKNISSLDFKRHNLGLHKELSAFSVVDHYKKAGFKNKLDFIAVITVIKSSERNYAEALQLIFNYEGVIDTESLLSKLSKQELESKVLIAREKEIISQIPKAAPNLSKENENYDLDIVQLYKKYKYAALIISFGIILSVTLLFNSEPAKSSNVIETETKIKTEAEYEEQTIPLVDSDGHKYVKVFINNSIETFLLDTGASTTLISENYINQLISDGFIVKNSNYLGLVNVKIADGSKVIGAVWRLPFIKIGEIKLLDVEVIALENIDSSEYLLGMSTLKKLGNYTIVPNENKIIIKN